MSKPDILSEHPDFSLVQGGPLFQLFRRARLSGDALELSHRRMIAFAFVSWLPLLLLSFSSGTALFGAEIPFLFDVEAHVRFLVALPILIGAELVVHRRISPIVRQFLERRIIAGAEVPKFHAAIESTLRLRNSMWAEALLLLLVYTVGLWIWKNEIALGTSTWYATVDAGRTQLTAAGYWFVFVSVPIFQFIVARWYLRLFLWFLFLYRVSKLDLRLDPMHPDHTAGLSFLGGSSKAFLPILVAQGFYLAGVIASQIFYAGHDLLTFKVEILGLVGFFVIALLAPLAVFTPQLSAAKHECMAELDRLATRYVREFRKKWLGGNAPPSEALLGNADIQSLTAFDMSFSQVKDMRVVPFSLHDAARLAVITLIPFLPLTLTMFSLDQLVERMIKVIL